MNRRRFIAALLASPFAVALAPLLPKNPLLRVVIDRRVPAGTFYVVDEPTDISNILLESLRVESTLLDHQSGVWLDFPQQANALRFQWQEDV